MAYEIFTPIDLNQNEIEGLVLDNLVTAPVTPVPGQAYFDTLLGYARIWNGTSWTGLSGLGSKFVADVGNGLGSVFVVTHNLNTKDFVASVFDSVTSNEVLAVVNHTTINTATITFSTIPLLNQYRVTILA